MTGRGFGVAAGLLLAACATMAPRVDFGRDFTVDLQRYAGLWNEVGRTPNDFQDNTLRRDGKDFGACFETTAEYAILDPATVSVTNTCTRRAADGTEIREVAEGEARVIEGSEGRRLSVAFGSPLAQFFQRAFGPSGGNYWIYCLGPVNGDGLYDWAVVSGEDKDMLFVLTRDAVPDAATEAAWRTCLAEEGLPSTGLVLP